jgi:general secretion pathway protein G
MSRNRKAFTLVEVLLVVVIIAGLAAVAFVVLGPAREEAKEGLTKTQIAKVMSALERYAGNLPYPTTDQTLKALVERPTFEKPEMENSWRGPYCTLSDLKDAWGTDLVYKLEEVTDSSGKTRQVPRVYSCGPNKTDDNGENDDIKDRGWQDESSATK